MIFLHYLQKCRQFFITGWNIFFLPISVDNLTELSPPFNLSACFILAILKIWVTNWTSDANWHCLGIASSSPVLHGSHPYISVIQIHLWIQFNQCTTVMHHHLLVDICTATCYKFALFYDKKKSFNPKHLINGIPKRGILFYI